ncbi:MAG: hypothetical protein ACYC6C_12660 [Coriobacteriia bacterium]
MGEGDVQGLKESISKVEVKMDTLMIAIADLRVLVADKYVSKGDVSRCQEVCEERTVIIHNKIDNHEKENVKRFAKCRQEIVDKNESFRKEIKDDRWKMAALSASIAGVIVAIGALITKGGV